MATNFLWGSIGSSLALLTNTQLASLANGTLSANGGAVNNASNYQAMRISVALGSAAFVDPSYIQIFGAPSMDGTNGTFPSVHNGTSGNLANYLLATIYINGATAAQNENLDNCYLPPGYTEYYALTGGSCPTLAATANTVTGYPTPTQY